MTTPDTTWLQRLTAIGFRRVGAWVLTDTGPVYRLDSDGSSSQVLYAFACNDEILYIGKTSRTLRQRMYNYQNPGTTQFTNIKCNQEIAGLLRTGVPIEILALVDTAGLEFGGFKVNLAAGLEDTLIREVQPVWNKMGM